MTDERGYNEVQEIVIICCVLTDAELNIFLCVHVINYHFKREDEVKVRVVFLSCMVWANVHK